MRTFLLNSVMCLSLLANPLMIAAKADTFKVEYNGKNIWLVHRNVNDIVVYRYRIGSAGNIAEIRHETCTDLPENERNLLAGSVQGENTGRVIQAPTWARGLCVPGTGNDCENSDDEALAKGPWNVNQAGDRTNLYHPTYEVNVNAAKTQIEIYAVGDRQWNPNTMPPPPDGALRGRIGFFTRYNLAQDGTLTIRRVLRLGTPGSRGVGTSTTFQDRPWLEPLLQHFHPWQSGTLQKELNAVTDSFDSTGNPANPAIWSVNAMGNKAIDLAAKGLDTPKDLPDTNGYTVTYDMRGVCNEKRRYAAVVYGQQALVQLPAKGLSATYKRRISEEGSNNTVTKPTVLRQVMDLRAYPATAALRGPGIVWDTTVKIALGPDVTGGAAKARLDALVPTVPATIIYGPGQTLPSDVSTIVSKLSTFMSGVLDDNRRLDLLNQPPIFP